MKLEDATAFTAGCFHGEPASCSYACPFHLDIRAFLEKVSKGRWLPAYKALRNTVVFPVIVSALCEQPCREHCQRTQTGDEAIAMRDIEAACIRCAKNRHPENFVIPPKQKRVAVIGAGPSGLACALALAQKKFPVTVFDKLPGWGGFLRTHPRFAEFDEDIALQFSTVVHDTEFHYGTEVTSLDALLVEFDAIYVATGAGGDSFGLLETWEGELQTTANSKVFLGGELCGMSPMEGIARGTAASMTIEVFLQVGKAMPTPGVYAKTGCGHNLDHSKATPVPMVHAAAMEGYTGDEAKAEAERCLQCDCRACLIDCEMLKAFRKNPHKIAVEIYNDMGVNPPYSVHTITREVYSCNICGYCKSICPESVDMGALIRFSRAARMSAGEQPAALYNYWTREMNFATSEGSFVSAPKGKTSCTHVFYPGCQLGASNSEHVLQSYRFLAKRFDTGIMLGCCGAPAYWAGDDTRLHTNVEKIRRDWNALGKPKIIFACASCENIFQSYMPEIPHVSLYELLADADNLAPRQVFPEAAVFDPCASRNDGGMQAGVRKLAIQAGVMLEELSERNRCCGHGGHIRVANPKLLDEIVRHRTEASAKPYIVYCANCREIFAERGKECAHILDMVFGVQTPLGILDLDTKRGNSLRVKRELMMEIRSEEFQPQTQAWDALELIVGNELRDSMTRKLMSATDLKEVIWTAETSGDKFLDDNSGTCLASLVKPVLTYWVEYKPKAPGIYEIFSAYYRRMRLDREE